MKKFKVILGLGRMANHHKKDFVIEAKDKIEAMNLARGRYHKEVGDEIGMDAPIWGKFLTIELIEEVK